MKTKQIDQITKIETKDTYEIAFYLIHGAKIEKVRTITLPPSKSERRGYKREWVITLTDVPLEARRMYRQEYCLVDLHDLVRQRKKLKEILKSGIYGNIAS